MKHHVVTKIETLLSFDDGYLGHIFDGVGPELRKELEERRDSGDIFIGSAGCDGFDPITGCPGHDD